MTSKYRVDPRIRALGKARIDVTRRATNEQEWQKMWREPRYPFPFTWGQSWKQSIQYIVDDYAAEIGFYIDVLGLPVYAFSPIYAMFTSPDQSFTFSVVPVMEGSNSTDPDTLRIQFMVNDIQNVTKELERRGVVFEQKPQPDPTPGSCLYIGYFRTPHGVCVDLMGEEEDPYAFDDRPQAEEEGVDELSVMDYLSELGSYPKTDSKPEPEEQLQLKEDATAEAPSEPDEPLHFDEDLWTLNSSRSEEESGPKKADLGEVAKNQNGSRPSNGSNPLPLKRVEESKRSGSGRSGEPFRRSETDLSRKNGSGQKPTNGRWSGIFPKPEDMQLGRGNTQLPLGNNGEHQPGQAERSNLLAKPDNRKKSENDGIEENGVEDNGVEDNGVEDNGVEDNGIKDDLFENKLRGNDVVEDEEEEDILAGNDNDENRIGKKVEPYLPEQIDEEELKYEDLDDPDLLDDSGDPY